MVKFHPDPANQPTSHQANQLACSRPPATPAELGLDTYILSAAVAGCFLQFISFSLLLPLVIRRTHRNDHRIIYQIRSSSLYRVARCCGLLFWLLALTVTGQQHVLFLAPAPPSKEVRATKHSVICRHSFQ